MKVHYINILLFAVPLNILVNTNKKPSITPRHIQTNRLLCECELYMSNYDNDPEMKRVMQQFHDRTTQRFQEYDEKLKEKRQICKDKCDKVIQKIILKDKIEKELTEKFCALHTDIQSDAIPSCICEKSLADKVEIKCLKCAQNMGGIVAPSSGVLAGIAEGALIVWKPEALKAAITAALNADAAKIQAAANAAGEAMGVKTVIQGLEALNVHKLIPEISKSFFNKTPYNDFTNISNFIIGEKTKVCWSASSNGNTAMCEQFDYTFGIFKPDGKYGLTLKEGVESTVKKVISGAEQAAKAEVSNVTAAKTLAVEEAQKKAIETTFMGNQTAIIASIVAIVVIVLILVIIYLILRYRRKNKMKKKLQYIKLLEE
ncbi:surface antigen [Plasmodium falciparum UGT5.1]|uniref:Surface antigen n=1 Tax=Plasmodium falciparum UGT5.1 TaxID=1237627 RepID=W7JQL7_PLAFA|nr:surface antigen [Plasmodium falciparum UGT5.1]